MSVFKWVREFVFDQDLYGHKIGVNFGGKTSYNTWLGVLCTLSLYVIIFQTLVMLSQAYFDGSRQDERINIEKFDRFKSPEVNKLKEMGVKLYLFPFLYDYEETGESAF